MKTISITFLISMLATLTVNAFAADSPEIVITLENHKFTPSEIHIPAHQKAVIRVKNLDSTAEEFESGALSIEKVIAAKSEGVIHLKATEHGHYSFVGEYHEKQARGVIVID